MARGQPWANASASPPAAHSRGAICRAQWVDPVRLRSSGRPAGSRHGASKRDAQTRGTGLSAAARASTLGSFARCLAPHGERILGIDISDLAIREARNLSRKHANLEFAQADIASFDRADQRFDLVVLADVLYYLSPLTDAVLNELAARMVELLAPGGLLLLVNHFFFGIDPASRMTGRIHHSFGTAPGLTRQTEHRRAFYLASIFERRGWMAG